MNIVLLIGGLLLILAGANALTDGAASVAKRFNISSLVIGLTIVAFGTSAPELTVSIVSALQGSADMAIGNDVLINDASTNSISHSDGLLLLCFFLIFLGYTFAIAHNGNGGEEENQIKTMPIWKVGLFIAGGLVGLIYGGQFFAI